MMKQYKCFDVLTLAALVCASTVSANVQSADLSGDSILVERNYPTVTTTYQPPIIIENINPINYGEIGGFTIAIDASTITATYTDTSIVGGYADVFDGFVFSGFSHQVSAVIQVGGIMPVYSLSFSPTAIYLNLGDGIGVPAINPGDSVKFSVSVVPEPATYLLTIAGLILVGSKIHRSQR